MKDRTKIGDPAIVKETGIQENILHKYGKITIQLDMKFDDVEWTTNGNVTDSTSNQSIDDSQNLKMVHPDSDIRKDGWYYTLTDGREYPEEDIIVSMEEIREYKISQIDGIQ